MHGGIAASRLLALGLTTALIWPAPRTVQICLLVATVHGLYRLRDRGTSVPLLLADVATASLLVATTGGVSSPFTLYAVITMIGVGASARTLPAVAGGLLIAAAGILSDAVLMPADLLLWETVNWAAFLPLVGGGTSLVLEAAEKRSNRADPLLARTHRLLSDLAEAVKERPGTLSVEAIARSVLRDVERAVGTHPALVLVRVDESFVTAATRGIAAPPLVPARAIPASWVRPGVHAHPNTDVPHALLVGPELPAVWYSISAIRGGRVEGLVVLAGQVPDESLHQLSAIAVEFDLALANAATFTDIRRLAIHEERRRIASDLHDGTAQDLAVARLRLDRLCADGSLPAEVCDEVRSVSHVVASALLDVRNALDGLRATSTAGGLSEALDAHVARLRPLVEPGIEFVAVGRPALDPGRTEVAYRIAQEAISNAVRHAGASNVSVTLEADPEVVALAITDDGAGMPAEVTPGHGLTTMEERARALQGRLVIRPALTGGTVVELLFPTQPGPNGPATTHPIIDLTSHTATNEGKTDAARDHR